MSKTAHLMFSKGKAGTRNTKIKNLDQKKQIPDLGKLVSLTVYGLGDNESEIKQKIEDRLELNQCWEALQNDRFKLFDSEGKIL
jgi:hypothetical protein